MEIPSILTSAKSATQIKPKHQINLLTFFTENPSLKRRKLQGDLTSEIKTNKKDEWRDSAEDNPGCIQKEKRETEEHGPRPQKWGLKNFRVKIHLDPMARTHRPHGWNQGNKEQGGGHHGLDRTLVRFRFSKATYKVEKPYQRHTHTTAWTWTTEQVKTQSKLRHGELKTTTTKKQKEEPSKQEE